MSEREALLAECEKVCTSGCHSDDCDHHGHIPAAALPVATAGPTDLVDFVLASGWANDRPGGPRTEKGHALASSVRRRLPDIDIDYDEWVRDVEVEAVSLALSRRVDAAAALRGAAAQADGGGTSSTSATFYLRDALTHWLEHGSSIEAADDLRTAAAEWVHDFEEADRD